VADSLQESIRHADTKVAVLFSFQCGMAALTVDRVEVLARIRSATGVLVVAAVLLAALLGGLAVATWNLAAALRPRLAGPLGSNRFSFPNLVRTDRRPPAASPRRQRDEAWDFALALARIALAKHERIQRSLPWLITAMSAAVGLLLVTTLIAAGSPPVQ
jgi:hypothetical protein